MFLETFARNLGKLGAAALLDGFGDSRVDVHSPGRPTAVNGPCGTRGGTRAAVDHSFRIESCKGLSSAHRVRLPIVIFNERHAVHVLRTTAVNMLGSRSRLHCESLG